MTPRTPLRLDDLPNKRLRAALRLARLVRFHGGLFQFDGRMNEFGVAAEDLCNCGIARADRDGIDLPYQIRIGRQINEQVQNAIPVLWQWLHDMQGECVLDYSDDCTQRNLARRGG